MTVHLPTIPADIRERIVELSGAFGLPPALGREVTSLVGAWITIGDRAVGRIHLSRFGDRPGYADDDRITVESLAAAAALVLLMATPAAYALSRFRLRRRKDLAFWILSQRMMPPIVAAFPLFFMFRTFGWIDTYHGLILVHAAINVPLATLLLMSFFDEVPRDLDDAAMVDGASRFGAFRAIVLNYVRGGLAATAVLAFVFSWNEFLLSLVLTTGGIRTVPVASSTFTTAFATEWGYLAALGTASMVPIFVFILLVQRHLVRGLTLGAVK